jgi:hypothetical protein
VDTLHDRLVALADDAPTGGAPAAALWARGKRAHRIRATALAATLLVVGAVGAAIGVRLADSNGDRSGLVPAETVRVGLPIEYPVGQELSDLGDTPGPLATIWLAPRMGGAPDAVGLVAETGTFGTLPIDLPTDDPQAPGNPVALSPDGRMIAYPSPNSDLVVRDLVSGEHQSPAFKFGIRWGYTWVDSTHLVGHVAAGSDVDGWVWEPGTAPKRVDLRTYPGSPWLGPYAGWDPWFLTPTEESRWPCPSLQDLGGEDLMPVLCDVVGVIGPKIALTHDGNGAVVALDRRGVEDPALRQTVATAGAPQRVTFATDLIGAALDAGGGAS